MQWYLWLLFIVSNPLVLGAVKDQLSDTPDAYFIRRVFHSCKSSEVEELYARIDTTNASRL